MTKDECYYLGKITKPFGIKGQVVLYLDVNTPEDYADLQSVLVEQRDGTLVPYFFDSLNINGNRAIVSFDGLTAAESQALVGHDIYLPLSLLPKLEGNDFYYHEVVNFHIVDKEKGDIGILRQVLDYPAQALFQIDHDGTEILIPVVDEIIERLDRDNKTIYINAPNGLIDMYLDNA